MTSAIPGRNGNELLIFMSDVVAHTNAEDDLALYQEIITKMDFGQAVSTLYRQIRCPGSITALGIAVRAVLKDLHNKKFTKEQKIPMGIMTVQELLDFKTIITDRLDSALLYSGMEDDPTGPPPEGIASLLQSLMNGPGPSSGIGLN